VPFKLPEGFPYKLTDAELDDAVDGMMARENWPGFHDDPFALLLPELKQQATAAGFAEKARRAADKEARITLSVAKWLAVAVVALVVSLVLAH
jgi:hypothetical protein